MCPVDKLHLKAAKFLPLGGTRQIQARRKVLSTNYRPPASRGTFTAVYCHQTATWQNGISVPPLGNVQVKVEAAADTNRARAPTAASAAQADAPPAPAFRPVHGYTTDDILKDKRFRVGSLQLCANFATSQMNEARMDAADRACSLSLNVQSCIFAHCCMMLL